jgi:hypothetical protein
MSFAENYTKVDIRLVIFRALLLSLSLQDKLSVFIILIFCSIRSTLFDIPPQVTASLKPIAILYQLLIIFFLLFQEILTKDSVSNPF